MKRLPARSVSAEIPTSSMADVAFLLILYFMVTTVLNAPAGLDMQLPPPIEGKGDPDPAIVIQVRADGVLVDCRPTDPASILPYLEPRLSRNSGKPVVIWAEPDASYQDFIEVYDALSETKLPDSPWGFRIENLSVPTASEIASYVDTFGVNPFDCTDGSPLF